MSAADMDIRRERYEYAMYKLQSFIHRNSDGTFELEDVDTERFDIEPLAYHDLRRSLQITNQKILSGEINPDEVAESLRRS